MTVGARKCLHIELTLGLGFGLARLEEEENSRYKALPICERRQSCPQVWITGVGRQRELKDEAGKAAWGHIVRGLVLLSYSCERGFRPSLWGPGETLNTVLGWMMKAGFCVEPGSRMEGSGDKRLVWGGI